MVEALEKEGRVQVIRPLEPVTVDRIERNVNKLTTFYEEGYRCAEAFLKLNK